MRPKHRACRACREKLEATENAQQLEVQLQAAAAQLAHATAAHLRDKEAAEIHMQVCWKCERTCEANILFTQLKQSCQLWWREASRSAICPPLKQHAVLMHLQLGRLQQ